MIKNLELAKRIDKKVSETLTSRFGLSMGPRELDANDYASLIVAKLAMEILQAEGYHPDFTVNRTGDDSLAIELFVKEEEQ